MYKYAEPIICGKCSNRVKKWKVNAGREDNFCKANRLHLDWLLEIQSNYSYQCSKYEPKEI